MTQAQLTVPTDIEVRLLEGCEVRATDKAGVRQFEGLAAPWDTWALIGGMFYERFQRNCFARSIKESAKDLPLLVAHNHTELPVGRAVEFRDDSDGLRAVWQLAPTAKADEVWTLIRDGSLSGLSVGFSTIPKQDHWETREPPEFDRVTRRNSILREVSVCAAGSFREAVIENTRTRHGSPTKTPFLNGWKKYADKIR